MSTVISFVTGLASPSSISSAVTETLAFGGFNEIILMLLTFSMPRKDVARVHPNLLPDRVRTFKAQEDHRGD